MISSSSQVRIRVSKHNRTLKTLSLEPGVIVVGRTSSSDLQLDDRQVSRRHCEIRLEAGDVTVKDLGSQNGSRLGDTRLPPQEATPWPPGVALGVGPFALQLEVSAPATSPYSSTRTWRIACGLAKPSVVVLKDKPITIGRDAGCDMVLDDPRVSRRQCEVQGRGEQLWVKDLSGHALTRVGNETLAGGLARVWSEGELLHLGPFSLVQSVETTSPTTAPETTPPVVAPAPRAPSPPGSSIETRMWQEWIRQLPWLPVTFVLGGMCLALIIVVGVWRVVQSNQAPATAVSQALSPSAPASPTPSDTPSATPTSPATPSSTPTPPGTPFVLPPDTPLPTFPPCTPQGAGWLDLPFPYDGENRGLGNAEQFRQASQRTAAGGRINSFFDHELPLYKREKEPPGSAEFADTLVLFDGSRSPDKWSHPDEVGDYYSGHPGLDFATFEWRKATTPVLAPAAGTLLGAGTDKYGNNYVLLSHDRGAAGLYQTSYLHLEPDEHWERMLELDEGTPIEVGERIGTMGNTGNSSGHHLHFEVRRDCNEDGRFTLDESVDPYGFISSPQIPQDPLAELTCGGSAYLWKYTLTPSQEGGGCMPPERRWQLDPAPFLGSVSLFTFIFTTADPSTPTPLHIPLSSAKAEKVDLQTVMVHLYDLGARNWRVVESHGARFVEGKVYIDVDLSLPGKYTVTGKPLDDIIAPTTQIQLSGAQRGDGAYDGAVTVELLGQDEGGSGLNQVQYSLDCGQTWVTYDDRLFTLTPDDLADCGRAQDSQEDERGLGQDEYLIMAAAVDWDGNWEQPPSQRPFKLVAAED